MDLNALESQVEYLRSNTVAQSSKNVYLNCNAKCIKWFFDNKIHLITGHFIEELQEGIIYLMQV